MLVATEDKEVQARLWQAIAKPATSTGSGTPVPQQLGVLGACRSSGLATTTSLGSQTSSH